MEDKKNIIIQIFEKIFIEKNECFEAWIQFADHLLKISFNGQRERHCNGEDVVREVMLRVIEGKRNWDPERVPDLDKFMRMTMRSFVSNLKKRERLQVNIDCLIDYEDNEIDIRDTINCLSLEEIEIDYDTVEKLKRFYTKLKKEEESDCLKVLDLMKHGYKNQEIAATLNISVREIVNIKRKIRYKLEPYI